MPQFSLRRATSTSAAFSFVLLAAGAGSFSMLQSLLSPVLSTIQQDLGTSQAAASWIIIAWLLAAAVATPILGRVGDMVGKARTLAACLAAVVIGSAVAAVAPSIELVIVGRILQGLGGAAFPLSFGIIRDEFPTERVPSAVGWMSSVIAVGGGVGMIVAGPIVELGGWRWLFWLPALVVLATLLLGLRFIPESRFRSGGRINWVAAILLAGWLLTLLLPLSQGSRWGWTSLPVLALLGASIVLFIAWLAVEMRTRTPLIDMQMMRLPAVWRANLVSLLFGATMFAIWAFLPQFVQLPAEAGYGFGASVSAAGWVMVPMLATMAVAGSLSGPLAPVVGFKWQAAGSAGLIAIACAGLAFYHATLLEIGIATAIFGIGLGFVYAALTSLVVQAVPAGQTGTAVGMNTNIRTIGGAVGTAVMTAIVTAQHRPDGLPLEQGFTGGFLLFAIVALVAGLVALMIPSAQSRLVPVAA